MQNGAVNLFWSLEVLKEARQELSALDYEIAEISCGVDVPSFESQMSRALRWKEQFGYEPSTGNLHALNQDGMRDLPFGLSGRSALVLIAFHHLVAADINRAHRILDIIEFKLLATTSCGAIRLLLWCRRTTLVIRILRLDADL